jgi:hypothetical protein
MKAKTKEELLQLAIDKGYFGDSDTLFACEDGNMWVDETGAMDNCTQRDIQYFAISKPAPEPAKSANKFSKPSADTSTDTK